MSCCAGLGDAAGELVGRESEVGDGALLGDGVGVAGGVALEEGFQLGVGGVDGLAQVVAGDDGVVEFDLDVLFAVRVADFLVAYGDAGGDVVLEPAQ